MNYKLALSFAALLGVALVTSQPVAAGQLSLSEFSSATAKKKYKRVVIDEPVRRAYGWRAADPSFDQYGRPYRPPAYLGSCVYDLGYGRFKSCHSDR